MDLYFASLKCLKHVFLFSGKPSLKRHGYMGSCLLQYRTIEEFISFQIMNNFCFIQMHPRTSYSLLTENLVTNACFHFFSLFSFLDFFFHNKKKCINNCHCQNMCVRVVLILMFFTSGQYQRLSHFVNYFNMQFLLLFERFFWSDACKHFDSKIQFLLPDLLVFNVNLNGVTTLWLRRCISDPAVLRSKSLIHLMFKTFLHPFEFDK